MHEDICTLALDRLTPLILVPLHRTWSIHGTIESEDQSLRALNCKVPAKVPCSVGIFFDRGRYGRRSIRTSVVSVVSVCMIFSGGSDDRGALSLAKRMAKSSNTGLTVIHFVAKNNKNETSSSEDKFMDNGMLESLKEMDESIVYKKYEVHDGPETVLIIHSFANLYDLLVLGRRFEIKSTHTIGLSEWIELPELGVFGDLFASKDLKIRDSVLVVQQQKQIKRLQ